jgi:alkylation response protein AidB-like acyl-CoA dehydrogenase
MTSIDTDELLSASRTAFQRSSGADALHQLGYWDLLSDLDDPMCLRAVMATFEAAGSELANSPALNGLVGQPYREVAGRPVRAAVWSRHSSVDTVRHVLVGPVPDGSLSIDTPGAGAVIVEADQVQLRRLDVPGRLVLHEIAAVEGEPEQRLSEAAVAPVREHATRLGRLALAFEMLGAARAALDLAVAHARTREQFGRPIGGFQAVQHILAWAATDCEGLAGAAEHALQFRSDGSVDVCVIVKALAGRNAMATCERALQVLGAIGFTAEHEHHHFHSRVLALDALLGTRADLTRQLGEAWRTDASDRRIPATALGIARFSS